MQNREIKPNQIKFPASLNALKPNDRHEGFILSTLYPVCEEDTVKLNKESALIMAETNEYPHKRTVLDPNLRSYTKWIKLTQNGSKT